MRLLCSTSPAQVFSVCDAINDLGGFAVAARDAAIIRERGKASQIIDVPRWPGYLFLSITEDEWHRLHAKRMLIRDKRVNPPRMLRDLSERQWAGVQTLLQTAEAEYQVAREALDRQISAGNARLKLPKHKRGDLIELLDGIFAGSKAVVVSDDGETVRAVADVELMGRAVEVNIGVDMTRAAE